MDGVCQSSGQDRNAHEARHEPDLLMAAPPGGTAVRDSREPARARLSDVYQFLEKVNTSVIFRHDLEHADSR
jgi:hypothetical protein